MDYYVFNSEQDASAAENYISTVAGCPIVCNNAKTGLPEPDKQRVERWAIPRQRITDNKWVFLRVPENIRSQYPQSVLDDFNNNHPHTIEEYDSSWFPSEI